MPNNLSAAHRVRSSEKKSEQNKEIRSRIKNKRKKMRDSLESGKKDLAESCFRAYSSVLDKGVKAGVIKKNTAIRRKKRSAKQLQKL